MADLRSIYIANGVGIFLMLVLLYAAKTKILRKDTEDKLFAFMIVGVMFGCVVEALAYTVDGQIFAGSRILNYAANTFLFTMNMLLPLTVLVYFAANRLGSKYGKLVIAVAGLLFYCGV